MTDVIHKYVLNQGPYAKTTIQLPDNFLVLYVTDQHGELTIWVELDPEEEKIPHTFYVLPTGGEIFPSMDHVGSVLMSSGLVWHVYYKGIDDNAG